MSDIHLDFDVSRMTKEALKRFDVEKLWFPPPLETDDDTIFIIPGDLFLAGKSYAVMQGASESYVSALSKRFKYVIIVLGNHDFWDGSLNLEVDKFKRALFDQRIGNVFVLQNEMVYISDKDGVEAKILGGTLWTDYGKGQFLTHRHESMKDYKKIKRGNFLRIHPEHLYESHQATKRFIAEHAHRDHPEQKVFVVTHHPPSLMAVPVEYLTFPDADLSLYHSDMHELIKTLSIDLFFHGHTHGAKTFYLPSVDPDRPTKVILNTRGYTPRMAGQAKAENGIYPADAQHTGYDPFLRLNFHGTPV